MPTTPAFRPGPRQGEPSPPQPSAAGAAERASDALGDAYLACYDLLSGSERDAVGILRHAFDTIAEGHQ